MTTPTTNFQWPKPDRVDRPRISDINTIFDDIDRDLHSQGVFVNVKGYGALGDGTTDDTTAITAAVAACSAGGTLFFPAGTYITGPQVHYANVTWLGESRSSTIVKLKAASNADLLVSDGFSTNTNTTNNGPQGFGLRSITLDGNKAQQTSLARCWKVYGYNYGVSDVWFINGYGGGVYSEWNGTTNPMEALWSDSKIWNYGGTQGAVGLDWNGPHDSKFSNVIVATLDNAIHPTDANYGATPLDGGTLFPTLGTPFTFATTQAAPTNLFPTSGGSFIVPLQDATLKTTWTLVTYTAASTTGSVTTFTGCTAPVTNNRNVQVSGGICKPTYAVRTNLGAGAHGAAGEVFSNCHFWGRNHFGLYPTQPFYWSNSEAEGAFIVNVITTPGTTMFGGAVYGTNGQTGQLNEVGIQIGTDTVNCGRAIINTEVYNVGGSSTTAGASVVVCNSSGYNVIRVTGRTNSGLRYVARPNASPDLFEAFCANKPEFSLSVWPITVSGDGLTNVAPVFLSGVSLSNPNDSSAGPTHFGGTGAPNIASSKAGDVYWRKDLVGGVVAIYYATDVNTWSLWAAGVSSVNGRSGAVTGLAEAADVTNAISTAASYTDSALSTALAGLSPAEKAADVQGSGLTHSGIGQTVNGTVITAGMRVLDTATGATSGLWVAATGAWTRPVDFATGSNVQGKLVPVDGGGLWLCVATAAVTVGTTSQVWTRLDISALTKAMVLATGLTPVDIAAATAVLIPAQVTSAGTAAANTIETADTTAGGFTRTLPTAPADGTEVGFKLVLYANGNNLTIACGGSDVINKPGGVTSFDLTVPNQAVRLKYKASTAVWVAVSTDNPLKGRRAVTGAATAVWNDAIEADTTSGAFAIALPTPVTTQGEILVTNIGANTLTLTGTISGLVNPTLSQWSSRVIRSNGTVLYFV